MYGGEERFIKYDGSSFMPSIQVSRIIDGEERIELVSQAYFTKFGNAVNWIVKKAIAEKEEEISILQFVTRFEVAVKELQSLKEEDLEF